MKSPLAERTSYRDMYVIVLTLVSAPIQAAHKSCLVRNLWKATATSGISGQLPARSRKTDDKNVKM